MIEHRDERVLAVIDRGTFRNPDAGYALAFGSLQADGSYRAVASSEFPNRGEIRIREGVEPIVERGSRVVLANVRKDAGYESEDYRSCAWVCLYSRELEELNRWDFCEVLSGTEQTLEDRIVELPFRPLDIIFIEDCASHLLYGPLIVTRFSEVDEEDHWRGKVQQYAFEPVATNALPKRFADCLSSEQYATLRTPISADVESSLIGNKDELGSRKLLHTADLNFQSAGAELIDLATDQELERWMGKAIKQVVESPADHLESLRAVQNLLNAKDRLDGPLWKTRVNRLGALGKLRILKDFPNGPDAQRESAASTGGESADNLARYVETNFDDLVKKSARAAEFQQKITELQGEVRDLERAVRDEMDKRKQQIRANEQAKQAGDRLRDQIRNDESRLASINSEISQEIGRIKAENTEELGAITAELETVRSDLEKESLALERAKAEKTQLESEKTILDAEILRTRNNYTADLIKHASLSDALAGRTASTPPMPYLDSQLSQSNEAGGEEVRREAFDKCVRAFRLAGRDMDEFDLACLLTSVLQNFFIIFYGDPGSGKTSLSRILSRFISCGVDHRNQFIQVQRGWSRGSEILGFQNVLNNTRENDPFGLFQSLDYFNR
ncbi:hypothetical protein N9V98_06605, partial [Luminiphilus sp.]|nr:hypothetical protein [Luminiphilus sp.]